MSEGHGSVATAGSRRHYFVDEAGDGTLFARRGRIIVGTSGCSRYFILGYVDIRDPAMISQEMESLRTALLADPYFRRVPSMQAQSQKTALAFHAKDDLPEVRREVMALLLRHELKLCAEVKDKLQVLQYVQQRCGTDPQYRYHPNELYDYLVRRLFRNALHKADTYEIHFAKRGKADRTAALQSAIEDARRRFQQQWDIGNSSAITVHAVASCRSAGTQVADYMLWALQRFYERGEDRYIQYLWPKCSLVHDIDDVRKHPYGTYYARRRPLVAAPEKEKPEI